MYLHDDLEQFALVVAAAAEAAGKPAAYVSKDYFVTLMLRETLARDPQLVFKGGTALSKCYGVIKRFSEDIDLGIEEGHATEGQRKRIKAAVKAAAESLGLSIPNIDRTRSKREFNRYEIPLPVSFAGSAVTETLYVETAIMTPISPCVERRVSSLVYDHFAKLGRSDLAERYSLLPFEARTTTLERSFCDKAYALCDYYLEKRDLDKPSRHLYDLHKLLEKVSLDESLALLMRKVGEERRSSSLNCPSAESNVRICKVLGDIVREGAYRKGYEGTTMRLLDLGEDVPYAAAVSSAKTIADFFESVGL